MCEPMPGSAEVAGLRIQGKQHRIRGDALVEAVHQRLEERQATGGVVDGLRFHGPAVYGAQSSFQVRM